MAARTKNPVTEVLEKALALIANPKHWTQDEYARTAPIRGASVGWKSPRAKCFCALGALRRAAGSECSPDFYVGRDLLNQAALAACDFNVISINDSYGRDMAHAKVVKAFKDAIKLSKRRTTGKTVTA